MPLIGHSSSRPQTSWPTIFPYIPVSSSQLHLVLKSWATSGLPALDKGELGQPGLHSAKPAVPRATQYVCPLREERRGLRCVDTHQAHATRTHTSLPLLSVTHLPAVNSQLFIYRTLSRSSLIQRLQVSALNLPSA